MKTKMEYPTDVFFLEVIPVIPPKFRPTNLVGGQKKENGQTMVLRKVVSDTYVVKTALYCYKKGSTEGLPAGSERLLDSLYGKTLLEKLQSAWQELQEDVNLIVDTSESKDSKTLVGFKQVNTINSSHLVSSA